jgi:glycosyltransferase involved in cell wall biosynthesis
MTERGGRGSVVILRSNEVAPDPRVEKAAKALGDAGWGVTILGWDRGGKIADEDRDCARIIRMRMRAPYGARFRNIPRKIRWNLWLLRWLWGHRREYTHIHACDLDTAVPAVVTKVLFRKKLVYDVFDNIVLQPDGLVLKAVVRMIKQVEDSVVKRADAVILADECRLELLGAKPKRLEFIYNSPDAIPPEPVEPDSHEPGLRIAYIGQLSPERGLMEMLDVVARRPEFTLDLAGFGADEERIAARAAELPNVAWHGRVGYAAAIDLSRRADVLFATYDPALPLHKYSSANKLFEAMMLGKPIIVARDTGMDAIVEKHRIGSIVDYADLDQLERALVEVMEMDDGPRRELVARARGAYDQLYSSDIMRKRLVALYDSLSEA